MLYYDGDKDIECEVGTAELLAIDQGKLVWPRVTILGYCQLIRMFQKPYI